MNENRIGRCLLPVSVTDRAVKNNGGYLPLPIVGEDGQPSGWPGEGPMCPPCPSRNPPVSFPRKQQSSPPLPLRERPAVPKAPPGEGVTVSFLRKQEPSPPLPLRERPAVPKAPPGEGATVSFLRKQQSSTPLPTAGEAGGAQGTAG